MTKDYQVGYGKPPVEYRFKKGRSGNPRGRPKKTKRLDSTIVQALDAFIPITADGKARVITKREAIARRLFTKALHGDARALEILIQFARETDPAEPVPRVIIKYG